MTLAISTADASRDRSADGHLAWISVWKAVSRENYWGAALLGAIAYLPTLVQLGYSPIAVGFAAIVSDLLNAEICAFSLLFALTVADRYADRGVRRLTIYGTAVLIAAVGGVVIGTAQSHFLWNGVWEPNAVLRHKISVNPWYFYTRYVYSMIEWMLIGSLATYVYIDRRDARRMVARLHEAGLRRSEQAMAMFESELQTLQARVEPGFLFRSLFQVRDLYDVDALAGETMLDELIRYLRAAMPRMRDTAGTLAQELDLVRSWITITDRCRVVVTAFECEPNAASARMPSMLLLPLVSALLAQRRRPDVPATFVVRVSRACARLRIALTLESREQDGLYRNASIEVLRERLVALFGSKGSLAMSARDGCVEALLEMPDEATDGTDR